MGSPPFVFVPCPPRSPRAEARVGQNGKAADLVSNKSQLAHQRTANDRFCEVGNFSLDKFSTSFKTAVYKTELCQGATVDTIAASLPFA